MILYHYTSLKTAHSILSGGRIGFSRPIYFDDLFDRPAAIPESTDPFDALLERPHQELKSSIWADRSVVLPLTRSPTNGLMWAHYADGHRGAVIEFDVNTAGFMDEKTNLIPAQFGSVVYSSRRPDHPYTSSSAEGVVVGGTHHFVISHYEKWQRLFLTKPLVWAYEEEVRVVKCLDGVEDQDDESINESGDWKIICCKKRPLHLCRFPVNAIQRVVAGARVTPPEARKLVAACGEIPLCRAHPEASKFSIELQPYPDAWLNLA